MDTTPLRVSGETRHVPTVLWRSLYGSHEVPEGFESNGCTFSPDYFYRRTTRRRWGRGWNREAVPVWPACFLHDLAYHVGGAWSERVEADWMLRQNVYLILRWHDVPDAQAYFNAMLYWRAVRLHGADHFAWSPGERPRTFVQRWRERLPRDWRVA